MQDKMILNYKRKAEGITNFKLYYRARGEKIQFGYKNRHIDQWNQI